MEKLEIKLKIKKLNIGILGGSFDPAHKGHLAISKEAIKKFNLKYVIWAITKQNPLKYKTTNDLKKRITVCKHIIGMNKLIKVKFFENIINSNKTADLINHLSKNKIPCGIYYPVPLHAQKAYADPHVDSAQFPVTKQLVNQVVSLPMHSELTTDQIDHIAAKVLDFFDCSFVM